MPPPSTLKRVKYNGQQSGKSVSIRLPFSKSLSHRLWLLNHLHGGDTKIHTLSNSRDTQVFIKNLSSNSDILDFQDAGTPARFALAYFAAMGKRVRIDGNKSLRNRRIDALVDALKRKGAEIRYLEKEEYFPVQIERGLNTNDTAPWKISTNESSQFVSALMLISSLENMPKSIEVKDLQHSWSYIQMTQATLEIWGIKVKMHQGHLTIDRSNFKVPTHIEIEADWSAAAFFYLTALITTKNITMMGLSELSNQGDAVIAEVFEGLGIKTFQNEGKTTLSPCSPTITGYISFDASDVPDLVPALISALVYLRIEAKIKGIENLKGKESDRIKSINDNIDPLNASLIQDGDDFHLRLESLPSLPQELTIKTHSDHRIAMAFAPWAAVIPNTQLDDTECTEKSFPSFWEELQKCGYTLDPEK